MISNLYTRGVSGDRAGATYIKLANCHLKVGVFGTWGKGLEVLFLVIYNKLLCQNGLYGNSFPFIVFPFSWKANMKLPKLMLMLLIAIRKHL